MGKKLILRKYCVVSSFSLVFSLVLLLDTGLYAAEPQKQSRTTRTSEIQGGGNVPPGIMDRLVLPQDFIDACSGKAKGDACQVDGPLGVEAGICTYTPYKKYFACKPNSVPDSSPIKKPAKNDKVKITSQVPLKYSGK
jgi:hypothetical protein